MARSNVRPTPGPSRKIATKITLPCPPTSRLYVLGLVDQNVVDRSCRSGPIMAQSNVRSLQEASRKKKIAAMSLCAAGANFRDLWAPLTPTVNIFAEYCIGTHSTVHQKQNCSHFLYSIQPTIAQCLSHHLSLLSKSLLKRPLGPTYANRQHFR